MTRQLSLLLLPAVIAFAAPPAALSEPLFAGTGKQSLVPPADIGHVSLGGYGARGGAAYEGVHDPILARALALRSGDAGCVVVALDRLEVPRFLHEDVCAALASQAPVGLAVGAENLILTASHTHSAPENLARHGDIFPLAFGQYNERLYRWTVEQVCAAIREAMESLQPASLGSAQVALLGLSANRRGDAATDPTLTVISLSGGDGDPLATVVSFAAHPTMLGAENLLISGDWPGEVERLVEQQLGGVCLFINGAQGDQRPSGDFGSDFERVERYGRRVADEVLATRAAAAPSAEPAFHLTSRVVSLPPRQPSPAFVESAKEEYPVPPEAMKPVLNALFPENARLQALRLGDCLLVTVPGEMTAELGLELKAHARAAGVRHPFVAGLANTYAGYILSPEEYEEGGYESAVSMYGADFGPWLVGELSALMDTAME